MNCKFCNEPLEEGANICPKCRKEQEPVRRKPKVWQLVVAIVGCVALLGALTVAVLEGTGIDATGKIASVMPWNKKDKEKEEKKDPETEDCDIVVATIGDRELTNGELQVYYWTHVFDYINEYYYAGLEFDPATPLDQQVRQGTAGETWHDYFLDMSFKTWQRYEAMDIIAKEAGLTLSEESQAYLDNLETYLEETATQGGFESVDAMIADRFGAGCSYRHYRAFVENYCIGLDFVGLMSENLELTDEEIEAYYNENLEELTKYNATKEDGNLSNVRHILISPVSEDEDATTFTEAQWAAALASAEDILAQWKSGEATEATFTELAKKHSMDPGVATNEGYYENVGNDTGYVEPFEIWAADPTREAGNTGIVKTDFGYHIMYCVSTQPVWELTCRQAILTEHVSSKIDQTVEKNPMTTHTDKIVLGDALEGKI